MPESWVAREQRQGEDDHDHGGFRERRDHHSRLAPPPKLVPMSIAASASKIARSQQRSHAIRSAVHNKSPVAKRRHQCRGNPGSREDEIGAAQKARRVVRVTTSLRKRRIRSR
jgi:hypothetical protein